MRYIAIKKIDKLLLRSFVMTFILLLGLVLFILVIHTFFVVFHNVAGKGLGVAIYAKLLFYIGLSVFPSAFPIAALVTSLLVFGHFAESCELTAMRSVGLSLQRTLRLPFIFVLVVSGLLFYFQDYIYPTTKHKIFALMQDVLDKKTALLIQPGVICNDIPGYSIHVDKKRKDNGQMEGIIVYDYTKTYGKVSLTIAEKGKLYTTPDESYLMMELANGHNYVEPLPAKDNTANSNPKHTFYRNSFANQKIRISLAAFKLGNSNAKYETEAPTRTRPQLKKLLEASKQQVAEIENKGQELLAQQCGHDYAFMQPDQLGQAQPTEQAIPSLQIDHFLAFRNQLLARKNTADSCQDAQSDDYISRQVIWRALYAVEQKKTALAYQKKAASDSRLTLTYALHEKHHRLALAVRCIIMFLLAAPLGCIIRRGGFGISVLISSFFILLEYMLLIFGKDLALANKLSAFVGAWLANFALLPFCFFFLLQAQQGMGLFSTNRCFFYMQKMKQYLKRKK